MHNQLIYDLYKVTHSPNDWDKFLATIGHVVDNDEILDELTQHLKNTDNFLEKEHNTHQKQQVLQDIINLLPYGIFYYQGNNIVALNDIAQQQSYLLDYLQKLANEECNYQRVNVLQNDYFLLFIPEQNIFITSIISKEKMQHSPLFEEWNLTITEKEICILLLLGYSSNEISDVQHRSIHTIRNQVKTILSKAGINTQQGLMSKFYQIPIIVNDSHQNDRKTHITMLSDGRKIAWCEYGDPYGKAVILCHSLYRSRYSGYPDAKLKAMGVRIITPDRPGFGASTPYAHFTPHTWADDLQELLTHLQLSQVSLIGAGHGGLFACAFASIYPKMTQKLVLVNSLMFVANNVYDGVGSLVKTALKLAQKSPIILESLIKIVAEKIIFDKPFVFLQKLYPTQHPDDLALFNNKAINKELIKDMAESNAQGFGKALSFEVKMLLSQKEFFNPKHITCDVTVYHSSHYRSPNLQSVKQYISHHIPHTQLHSIDDGRVFIFYHLWQEYMQDAITY
jgi:pimeloyl-ACP methyl ester carboxylesterase/DNA-binding CsgD family transcriptional regulator